MEFERLFVPGNAFSGQRNYFGAMAATTLDRKGVQFEDLFEKDNITVRFERRGRYTMCLIKALSFGWDLRFFWGCVFYQPTDPNPDNQEIANLKAFNKAIHAFADSLADGGKKETIWAPK